MYSYEVLSNMRRDLASAGRLREWKAQYQQKPTAEEGVFIKREWMQHRYTERPLALNVYMASDFAVTEPEESRDPDWTCHGVFGVDKDNKIYVLDWWRGRTTPDVWIDVLIGMMLRWKPRTWFGEAGPIRRSIEPFLVKRMLEKNCYTYIEWIASVKDKSSRGRSLQALASMSRILWPAGASWIGEVIETIVGFPTMKHDDDFDVLSLMCLAIDEAHPAVVGSEAKRKKEDPWRTHKMQSSGLWKTV
jgi:predicted phage terminase large subunit-like protein